MKNPKQILICGAGIAGLTAAYWLDQFGYSVDIIDKAKEDATQKGYMIDFWGPGYAVADKMQLIPTLKKYDHILKDFIFLSQDSNKTSRFEIPKIRALLQNRIITLLRGNLEKVLREKINAKVTTEYETYITDIKNNKNNITVTLQNGTQKNYDLLIGADGTHSKTRASIFGDEKQFTHDLGFELAALKLPNPTKTEHDVITYAQPNQQVTICPTKDNHITAYFSYREKNTEIADRAQALKKQFKNTGWMTSEIIENIPRATAAFYDRLVQIKMPTWHKNRVVLIGDAAHCMTLMAGQGASIAMADGYVLAKSLQKNPTDYSAAFTEYENTMKDHITAKQTLAENFAAQYIPQDELGLLRRNYFTRQFFKKMYQVTLILP